ncbi:UbiH/UbiF family hydroxylase [Halovulum dunhuangense]|uniref:UbiH/UbiF family hydroxylase n=1 Tax=Halovulum dunhuangense TaxID=1505036 RepID=A0A849L457_9RHOB|nr:FAD-dependent monooxygenase [Halovulum dunhuangense]NNU80937.1 UbiH/UbiF family hydroxylase [Halovulum dunhuangense]
MDRTQTDIVIAGGGIAGLTATAIFAAAGFRTICVEPSAPVTTAGAEGADLRSTAFLEPAIALFDEAGLWDRFAPHATDLRVMRLADAGGAEPGIREVADFDAAEIGQARFGVNLPNWLIRREILAHLEAQPLATLLTGAKVARYTPRTREAIVTLSDGRQIRAALALAADGRDSFLRQAVGIEARRWDYGQRAMVFAVSHPLPHQNVSTEIHRTGGPFTLVPLPDQDGVPHSAVVWMETGPEAARLAALDDAGFEAALNERSCGVLGPLALASRRVSWPIISQIAARLDGPRLALVAEAAHVIPPIGAQGLNMSLADIRALRDLCVAARDRGADIGAPDLLARYNRARHADIAARVTGVDVLNRAAMAEAQGLRDLRRAGLRALYGAVPVRRVAMRAGLGA